MEAAGEQVLGSSRGRNYLNRVESGCCSGANDRTCRAQTFVSRQESQDWEGVWAEKAAHLCKTEQILHWKLVPLERWKVQKKIIHSKVDKLELEM